ncbi:restriction endonuclease subunit S [[Eubacterium] hominis]|uniref:restriction endonuclease subunit S n=1 Tax=[Eubacterium] hominis TaxID=2764325 RepID=UPI0022E90B5F
MANVSSSNGLENRPKLRFPGFDEPWKATAFGDIVHEFSNRTKVEDEDVLLSAAIEGMFLNTELFGHQRGASNKGYKKIKYGTMVLSTQNLHLGNANVNQRFEHGMVSPAYKTYDISGCSIDLIAQWIKSDAAKRFFYNATTVGASVCRRNVEWDTLYEQSLFLPSLPEQEKIANLLTLLSNRIEKQRQLIIALKKYKRGLLFREFAPFVHDASDIEYEGKIHDFFSLSSGSTPSSTNKAFYSGSIRWVSSGELKPKYLYETNQHISSEAASMCNLREYPANTLLIAMYGLEAAGVRGTASILGVPSTISQACMAIQQTGEIDVEYLYYWYIYNGQWIGIRIAQGTKQQNLSTDTLGNLKINAPSLSKQKEVCKLLSHIDNRIEKENQKLDLLTSIKRGLLHQLFM